MNDATTVERLSTAIRQAARSAMFCVTGCLPAIDPGLEVAGLGPIKFPLKRARAKELIAACQVAPYGQGTRTLVNKNVRNTFELDPKKFQVSDDWNAAIVAALRPVAEQLGLPPDQLEARLYKLLVYEKGGFFLPHRDSEKQPRMVASMIIVLPHVFEGGALIVRHGAAQRKLTFDEAAAGKAPCFAAFYADCEHEVQRVTGGIRVCLAYNLALKPHRVESSAGADSAAPVEVLAESIGAWVTTQPATPLVFALEHQYTQQGLSLDLLKGEDRHLANLVVAAAEKTDCHAHLAQVSRHLSQYADDGSYDHGRDRRQAPHGPIDIGETYEDDLKGAEWTDLGGKKQPWGEIEFDPSAIVSSQPLDDWKPTSEDYRGYTGNEGNTLDRWYHRSAIVVWQRDQHFEVVASAGAEVSIPLFCSLAATLSKTPKKRLEQARLDCIRFARAIIQQWPNNAIHFRNIPRIEKSPQDEFPGQLLALHDQQTSAMFLAMMGERDATLPLASFVLAVGREFGWSAFAPELKRLILSRPYVHGPDEVSLRDIEWLAAFCREEMASPDQRALVHELCLLAVERYCTPRPRQPAHYWRHDRRETSVAEKSLLPLLQALAACGCEEGLSRVIKFVQESPDSFSFDDCQVPCLKALIPWARTRFGLTPPLIVSWLASVRQQLESAAAKQPTPPTDWVRPATVDCNCSVCVQLNAFLADPASEKSRIAAREDLRQHLIQRINYHQCDVEHTLDRKGSPHALALVKTNESFKRAVQRFEADCKLLSALPTEN